MPITRIPPRINTEAEEAEISIDVFHVQESFEVYDGALALAIDHLLNDIKTLVSLAYLPGSPDLEKALKRHPALRRIQRASSSLYGIGPDGRAADRVLLADCQRLLDGVLEIAHLSAWPETVDQATTELESLQKEVPFLDYRYDNDPFPSDKDHEEPRP